MKSGHGIRSRVWSGIWNIIKWTQYFQLACLRKVASFSGETVGGKKEMQSSWKSTGVGRGERGAQIPPSHPLFPEWGEQQWEGGVIPAFRANHIYVPSRRVSGLPSTPSEFPFQGFFNGSLMGQEWPGIGVWTPTLRERLGCGLVAHLRHQSPWYWFLGRWGCPCMGQFCKSIPVTTCWTPKTWNTAEYSMGTCSSATKSSNGLVSELLPDSVALQH